MSKTSSTRIIDEEFESHKERNEVMLLEKAIQALPPTAPLTVKKVINCQAIHRSRRTYRTRRKTVWTERRSNAIQGLQYKNVFRREKGQDRGGEMFLIFWNYLLQFVVSIFFLPVYRSVFFCAEVISGESESFTSFVHR